MKKNILIVLCSTFFLSSLSSSLVASQREKKITVEKQIALNQLELTDSNENDTFQLPRLSSKQWQILDVAQENTIVQKKLFTACATNKYKTVDRLSYSPTFSIYKTNKSGDNACMVACRAGNTKIVELFLTTCGGIETVSTDSSGNTLLHITCQYNHTEITKLLCDMPKISLGDKNNFNSTPLHSACANNSLESLKILFNVPRFNPRLINVTNKYGLTPLAIACMHGHTEIVKLLLEQPNTCPNNIKYQGVYPLHEAAQRKECVSIVALLLAHPATEPNILERFYGDTPLHIACGEDNEEAVKLLLQHNQINPNTENRNQLTALHIAVYNKNLAIVSLLLSHRNTNPNCLSQQDIPNLNEGKHSEDYKISTPLHIAIRNNDIPVALALLAHKNINPNEKFLNHPSCLRVAEINGNTAMKELLLHYNAK